MAQTSSTGRYRDALGSRDLRLLLMAFLVDSIGGWAYSVVLIVWVFDRTGAPGAIAITTACGWVPRLVLSTYAGVIADRHERTRVMAVSALASAVLTVVIVVGVAVSAPVAVVLVVHVALASSAAFYGPTARSVVPDAVPERDLAAANGLFGVLENLVVVVGPAVGGLLLLVGEPAAGVAFNGLTFLVAAGLVRALRLRSRGGVEAAQGLWAQLVAGFAALGRERTALVLVLYAGLDSAIYGALTVFFVPLSVRFGTGSEGYSYLLASMALGGVLAGGLVNKVASGHRLAPVIVGGMLALALPVAAAAFVTVPVVGAILQVASGAGMVFVDVLAITALQRDVAREALSRVFGILETVCVGAILLGSALASLLLSLTSLTPSLLAVGVGFAAAAVLGMAPLVRADAVSAAAAAQLAPRVSLLESLDLFAAAPRPALEQLARSLERVELPAGTPVVREGDPADALFVIDSGELLVTSRGEGAGRHAMAQQLRVLGPSDYFGEIGLLRRSARTATVATTTPAVLWRLAGPDFLAALESNAPSASILRVAGARLARTHPALAAEPFVPPGAPGRDDAAVAGA